MIWLKRGLSLLLLAVLIYFFLPLLSEIRAATGLFRHARWTWLAIAIILQVVSYGFLTWLNAISLQPFSGRIGFFRLAALLTAMAFIQIAIPSAGASGVALRVRLLGRYGYQPEESLFSLLIESLAEMVFLAASALLGLVYLLRKDELKAGDLSWLALAAAAFGLLLWWGWKTLTSYERGHRILVKWVNFWNPRFGRFHLVRRSLLLDLPDLERRLAAFQANLYAYRGLFWKVNLAALGKVLVDVACLGAAFSLFNHTVQPGTLLTGYGLILTFSGAAALPAGIGMADASVPVIFSWLGVAAPLALAAGLTYRLIAYWLVRFIGFISWQILESTA
jgi:uncharacterized protein (TIRG00374 family)